MRSNFCKVSIFLPSNICEYHKTQESVQLKCGSTQYLTKLDLTNRTCGMFISCMYEACIEYIPGEHNSYGYTNIWPVSNIL